ncbi:hypothetical protein FRC02_010392 [Tulasnella sp. 418]|nr:hypothetical protein FRC02_010392 [Tulasnella sp. 418]
MTVTLIESAPPAATTATTATSRPPPSSFPRLPPITTSNPAPTPPPASPLPALPTFPSPLVEQDYFGSFSRPSLDKSGWRHSVASSIRDDTINGAFLLSQKQDLWSPNTRDSELEHARSDSGSLIDTRRSSRDRELEKKRTTLFLQTSNAAQPVLSRRNPTPTSSNSATLVATPSSRNSVASDIVSLAETSRSLQDLSRRLSTAYNDPTSFILPSSSQRLSSASLDSNPQDPFEFDRFDDPQNLSSYHSRTSLSASSSSHSTSSHPPHIRVSTTKERNHAHYLLTHSRDVSRTPQLSPTSIFTFGHQQQEPPMATLSELLEKQRDLAGKRANLDALRAEILGIPMPRSPTPIEHPPPRPSTSSSTISLSSTSTARPGAPIGIFVRPSTSSSTRSPTKSAHGDSQSSAASEFSINSSLQEDGAEDSIATPHAPTAPASQNCEESLGSSPEISRIIKSVHIPKAHSRSQSRARASSTSSKTPISSEAGSRPSTASVSVTSGKPARNWSYPTDRVDQRFAGDAQNGSEPPLSDTEDDLYGEDPRPSSYYYGAGVARGTTHEAPTWDASNFGESIELTLASGMVKAVHVQEDDDGTSSESSLDLHTPLPDLMVKAGILSPRSALLATRNATESGTNDSAKSKEEIAASLRKGAGSKVLSKSRLVRHRDGKMLGLGLGLTTGLGWSDSEDEDAPSPLRRHISQIILHKKCSVASISTLASSAMSDHNGSFRRDSILSNTTGRMSTISRKTSILSSSSLQKSHSLASISSVLDKPVARRQLSSPNPNSIATTVGPCPPPSSFTGGRRSRVSSKASVSSTLSSRPSTSSLRQAQHQLPPPSAQPSASSGPLTAYRTRSPSSSNTSISTSSSMISPVTPASVTSSPSSMKIESHATVSPISGGSIGLGILAEESTSITTEYYVSSGPNAVKRIGPPSRPEIRRLASSNVASTQQVPTPKAVRPRPSAPNTSPIGSATPPTSTLSGAATDLANAPANRTRQRTTSTGSSAAPMRKRTISGGSTTSGVIKSKPSFGSLRSVAMPSNTDTQQSTTRREGKSSTGSIASVNQSIKAPPPLSMTVGSLAFPSPPPLSPAMVNLKLAQVQAQQQAAARKQVGSQLANFVPPR